MAEPSSSEVSAAPTAKVQVQRQEGDENEEKKKVQTYVLGEEPFTIAADDEVPPFIVLGCQFYQLPTGRDLTKCNRF